MSTARTAILDRLRRVNARPLPVKNPDYPIWTSTDREDMLVRLTELLEQNHAEVTRLPRAGLVAALRERVSGAGLKRLATGTGGEFLKRSPRRCRALPNNCALTNPWSSGRTNCSTMSMPASPAATAPLPPPAAWCCGRGRRSHAPCRWCHLAILPF
ncbi:hypothetical protein MBH78_06615 [Oceanimonas sp. NS1]|nr:hypothetical protein [Oceanimonas sp. NS1]